MLFLIMFVFHPAGTQCFILPVHNVSSCWYTMFHHSGTQCFILLVHNAVPNPTRPSVQWALPFSFPATSLTAFHPFCNLCCLGSEGFNCASHKTASSVHCGVDCAVQHLAQCSTTSHTSFLTVPGFPLQLPWVCHCKVQMNCSVG